MRLDKYDYFCSNCKEQLDVKSKIHLKTKRLNGDLGEIFLSTKFGDYQYQHIPIVGFNKGELVDFMCPHCSYNLKSTDKNDFVSMIMRVENQFDFEILFSRKAGIQKTYVVTEDGVECYGKDCEINNNRID